MSHFFAYLSRMRFIRRWGLMHSTHTENIQEHSLRVAMIAHALAVIRNRLFGGAVNPEHLAVRAMYHDASEVLTGDLPRPVKYFNPEIETSYRRIEAVAREKLLGMVPAPLQADYGALLGSEHAADGDATLIKAADKLCAYLKCLEEITAGNREFAEAEKTLRRTIEAIDLPEVRYFVQTFVPSFRLTLDDLR
ncbi:MAG TPA: 5'-deoxynucleotidase [Methylomirabilota bacterium]|nr:5'-deoxynucleotidase [Methylomirabilota bacterium]